MYISINKLQNALNLIKSGGGTGPMKLGNLLRKRERC